MKLVHGRGFSRSSGVRKPEYVPDFTISPKSFAVAANGDINAPATPNFRVFFASSDPLKGGVLGPAERAEFCLRQRGKAFWQQSKRNPKWPG
jgi:hypothetical protein